MTDPSPKRLPAGESAPRRPHALAVPLVAAALAAACAWTPRGPFEPDVPESGEAALAAVLASVAEAPPRQERPVAVGVTASDPPTLYAYDLEAGRTLWEQPVTVRSAPLVLGDLVVTEEADAIVARDLETGAERFSRRSRGLRLLGGDGEGDRVVLALSTGSTGGEAASRVILAQAGEVVWTQGVGFAIGRPALRGGYVFVPWMTHTLSVLDAADGRQVLRLRMDDVIGHAFVDRGQVYTGQHAVFRVTTSFARGEKAGAARYAPAARPLPGQPPLLLDGYEPPLGADSAVHRVRLAFEPAGEGETVAFEDGTLYFLFYRLAFGFDADSETLRWVAELPADVVGAAVRPGGVLVADEGGGVSLLSAATGQRIALLETGERPVAVALRPGAWVPAGEPEGAPPSLDEQLFAAARLDDARLAGARALAVRLLARSEDGEVTGQLIAVCEDGGAPGPVREAACEALGERTTGEEHVMTALRRQAAFLQGVEAPPVGPLARAAERMELGRAVPLLLQHLEDPHTPDDALPPLLQALRALGNSSTIRPVEGFLVLYHADPSSPPLTQALATAVDTLADLRGRAALEPLRQIAADSMSVPTVRARAAAAVARIEGPSEPPAGPPPSEPPPAARPPAAAPPAARPPAAAPPAARPPAAPAAPAGAPAPAAPAPAAPPR